MMLQQELWTAQLGAYSHTEPQTALVLQQELAKQIVSRLDRGESVRQSGVAVWSTQFEREYVAVLDDGRHFFVPPAVSLYLREMPEGAVNDDERIINALAELTGFAQSTVSGWYKAIPRLMSDRMSKGLSVCMVDLGCFVREGERIVFDPCIPLTDRLNRPFSSFSPTLVRTGTSIADTEEKRVKDEASFLDRRIGLIRNEASYGILPTEAFEELIIPKDQAEIAPDVKTSEMSNEERLQESTLEVSEGTAIKTAPKDEEQTGESNAPQETSQRRRKRWWIIVLLLIVAQLVFLLWFFSPSIFDRDIVPSAETHKSQSTNSRSSKPETPSRQESAEHKVEEVITTPSPTLEPSDAVALTKSDDSKMGLPEKKEVEPKDPEANKKRANTMEVIRVKPGDRLARIARQKYGHRAFWVYIYQENRAKISSPDILPEGLMITLPPAVKYAIDASDNNSVAKALALQYQINAKQ